MLQHKGREYDFPNEMALPVVGAEKTRTLMEDINIYERKQRVLHR